VFRHCLILALAVVVGAGVIMGGIEQWAAGAAPRAETPAHKIVRLRAKATRVQRVIERMNARVESLVEDYNEVREALGRTRSEQERTERRIDAARRRLEAARRQLGRRLWVAYTGGAPTALGQLLGAESIHQALTTATYQERVVGADRAAIERVARLERELEALAAELAGQRKRQERLQARLVAQRQRIEARLAAQRHYLSRLTKQVKRAIVEERRRQEELRRRALLRRLAAERAARLRAARARAALAARGVPWGGAAPARGPSGAAGQAVAFAMAQIGKPYLWGAAGPSAYDCSGLVLAAYRSAGIYLPRVSRAQWYAGQHVGLGELAPGDLVFFAHDVRAPSTIHHVGMYIGGGAMVEAPYTGARVRTASIGRRDYIGAVRPT
jgi:cell wall-associated NlpC family hydrolase/outer membrane murein-binding lipoprotein Lpp